MTRNTDSYRITFHAIAIGCQHIDIKKLSDTGRLYNHHVSSSSLANPISSKHFFHVFLISQRCKNYMETLKNIKLQFSNSIMVVLVENPSDIHELLEKKELFYILPDSLEFIDLHYHQLWQWLFMMGTKKFSFDNENNVISIAGGILSINDNCYKRDEKKYDLTRKQMDILKLLLAHIVVMILERRRLA